MDLLAITQSFFYPKKKKELYISFYCNEFRYVIRKKKVGTDAKNNNNKNYI